MAEQFAENANTTLDNIPTTAFPAGAPPAKRWIQPVEKNAGAVLATTHQSAVAADGNGTPATVSGYGGIVFQVTGTFAATVNFEATVDGANWVALPVMDASGAQRTTTLTPGIFWANILGLEQVRARISGYTSGAVTVVSRALAEPMPIQSSVQLSGRNPVRRIVRDTPLTAGEQVLDSAVYLTTVSPHIALLSYEVRSDTSVKLELLVGSEASPSLSTVASVRLRSPNANAPAHVPRFIPMGSRYRVRVSNPTAVDQTVLEVEELRHSDWVHAPQNLKAWLVDAAPASLFTNTTTVHTPSSAPNYFDRLIRVAWGGGKVPVYAKSTLDQGVDLDIVAGAWDPAITPALGTKEVPAGATIVITNADFAGIDVPSEILEVHAKAQVVPSSGVLDICTDTQVGGSA